MIVQFDPSIERWVAAGRGYMRPIAVEGDTIAEAAQAYYQAVEDQKADEYAMEQQMSHLADVSDPTWTETSGYDYER